MAFTGAFIIHVKLNTTFIQNIMQQDVNHIYVMCVRVKFKFTKG